MSRGVSAIVLAGGGSARFGSDKLAAVVDGRSLLERAVTAAAAAADEVVVVLAPGDDRPLPAASVPVRRAHDEASGGGPLVGLLAGLELAREPAVLVVGGDMPSLVPAVLSALVRALAAGPDDAVALRQRGVVRPLPVALRTGTATAAVRRLVADGEGSLRAVLRVVRSRALDEDEWRALDPGAETLRDVDRPSDLRT